MSEKEALSSPYKDDGTDTQLPLPTTNPAPSPSRSKKSKLFKLALIYGAIGATWYLDKSFTGFLARNHSNKLELKQLKNEGWGMDPYVRGLVDKGWKIDGTVDDKLLELLESIDVTGDWLATDRHDHQYKSGHHKKDKHKHKKHGKDKKKKHGHHHHDDHHHHHHGPPGHHHPGGPHGPRIGPKEAESIFLRVPNNDSVAAASKRYTAYPHMAGTGTDLVSAINLKAEYESLLGLPFSAPYAQILPAGSEENQRMVRGLGERDEVAVWVDEYYPLMNKPVHRSVEIILPDSNGVIEWSAKLREDIVEGDPDSVFRDEVPTFHGLSVSGNVTGKIVFAGYGTKRDFDALEAKGFDLRSEPTIVLVKYGKVFRGLKIKAAQEAGALACLIYSDPGDDGEITLKNGYEAYPDGPARQPSSVQRGSVQFLSSYPGDPATPGYPAYKNATRVPGGNFPSIPSLPLSYQDALPLLKTLQGHGMPAVDVGDDWVGGLTDEVDYWTGPGDRDVRFVNEVDTKETPIWSVFGYIPGHIKDELVVLGNHRDAWVLGGADPSSGTATMYEVMRGLNELMRKGWKPMRSILIASWDAEEYGLISSTEFAEDFGDWIQSNVVAYLNLDVSVSGTNFHGSASPSLANLLKGAAEQVEHPTDPARSLWEMKDGGDWKTYNREVKALSTEVDFEDLAASRSGVGALGSGSDYTAFLQRYGVASTDMGYGGGPNDPPYHYHSIYDSFTWQSRYGDPGFAKHTAAAKMLGLMALRLADSLVLPLNVTQYAHDLSGYLAKVEAIAQTSDYKVDFTGLSSAISEVQNATSVLDSVAEVALKKLGELLPHPSSKSHPSPFPPKKMKEIKQVLEQIRAVNNKLAGFESGFLSKQGIKDREWYKHKGTAPGKWLGYGATTFPGLTEAMTIDHDVKAAQEEADELEEMMLKIAQYLKI